MVYGTLMGTCCLMTFVFIVYGPGPDGLGEDCNKSYNASCDVVFRARAAVFAELTWIILISAWEFKSLRRSMFSLNPHHTSRKFPFFHDIYENKFLFWAVIIGALSVFPAVYIPYLNTNVFKHKGITWEWAPAVLCVLVFVSGVEVWKAVKRRTGWFAEQETEGMKKSRPGPMSLRQGFFSLARTMTGGSVSRSRTEEMGEMGRLGRVAVDGGDGDGDNDDGRWSSGHTQRLPKVKEDV